MLRGHEKVNHQDNNVLTIGFYRYQGGTEACIARALAYAPYADLLWCIIPSISADITGWKQRNQSTTKQENSPLPSAPSTLTNGSLTTSRQVSTGAQQVSPESKNAITFGNSANLGLSGNSSPLEVFTPTPLQSIPSHVRMRRREWRRIVRWSRNPNERLASRF